MDKRNQHYTEEDFEKEFIGPNNTCLLPTDGPVLVICKHRPARRVADIIGLDRSGALVIIEVKNERSTREAIGQALEYLAMYADASMQVLADEYQPSPAGANLEAAYRTAFARDLPELPPRRRVYIAAPSFNPPSEMCVRYIRKVLELARAETSFEFLKIVPGRGVEPYQLRKLVWSARVTEGFAESSTEWVYLGLSPGVLWKIGRKIEEGSIRIGGKKKHHLDIRRKWLTTINDDEAPKNIRIELTGTTWRHKTYPQKTARVIGEKLRLERGGTTRSEVLLVCCDASRWKYSLVPRPDLDMDWEMDDALLLPTWGEIAQTLAPPSRRE